MAGPSNARIVGNEQHREQSIVRDEPSRRGSGRDTCHDKNRPLCDGEGFLELLVADGVIELRESCVVGRVELPRQIEYMTSGRFAIRETFDDAHHRVEKDRGRSENRNLFIADFGPDQILQHRFLMAGPRATRVLRSVMKVDAAPISAIWKERMFA